MNSREGSQMKDSVTLLFYDCEARDNTGYA